MSPFTNSYVGLTIGHVITGSAIFFTVSTLISVSNQDSDYLYLILVVVPFYIITGAFGLYKLRRGEVTLKFFEIFAIASINCFTVAFSQYFILYTLCGGMMVQYEKICGLATVNMAGFSFSYASVVEVVQMLVIIEAGISAFCVIKIRRDAVAGRFINNGISLNSISEPGRKNNTSDTVAEITEKRTYVKVPSAKTETNAVSQKIPTALEIPVQSRNEEVLEVKMQKFDYLFYILYQGGPPPLLFRLAAFPITHFVRGIITLLLGHFLNRDLVKLGMLYTISTGYYDLLTVLTVLGVYYMYMRLKPENDRKFKVMAYAAFFGIIFCGGVLQFYVLDNYSASNPGDAGVIAGMKAWALVDIEFCLCTDIKGSVSKYCTVDKLYKDKRLTKTSKRSTERNIVVYRYGNFTDTQTITDQTPRKANTISDEAIRHLEASDLHRVEDIRRYPTVDTRLCLGYSVAHIILGIAILLVSVLVIAPNNDWRFAVNLTIWIDIIYLITGAIGLRYSVRKQDPSNVTLLKLFVVFSCVSLCAVLSQFFVFFIILREYCNFSEIGNSGNSCGAMEFLLYLEFATSMMSVRDYFREAFFKAHSTPYTEEEPQVVAQSEPDRNEISEPDRNEIAGVHKVKTKFVPFYSDQQRACVK